jgi:glycogen phosphorylase
MDSAHLHCPKLKTRLKFEYNYILFMPNPSKSNDIAYFSLELGLDVDMKTYCGGLGILAGDTLKSAADLGLNFTGVSLLYKKGWFKQVLDPEKGQKEEADLWDYQAKLKLHPETFHMTIAGENIKVQIWEYIVKGFENHKNSVFFLDADLPENSEGMRKLNQYLYPNDHDTWLKQEILLGYGGFLALKKLGFPLFDIYHLNESHVMSLILTVQSELNSWDETRKRLCFTTHTPLKGAHQKVSRDELLKYLPADLFDQIPADLWENDELNFTTLCTFASKFTNAVAKRHMKTTQEMYPEYKISSVTNGVHHLTWTCKPISKLFDKYLGDWQINPENLRLANQIPDSEIRSAHDQAKKELIKEVNSHSTTPFDPNIFTIGFARRAVPYKRANLIFTEIQRLTQIAEKFGGLQLIFAGKTSPDYDEGKIIIKQILDVAKQSNTILKVVYLPDYNISLGQKITSGVDMWLNNPLPPLEASGTSGMKASLNGVPNFSILDGWWPEGWVEGVTGWSIGQDLCEGDQCKLIEISDLYGKLENLILPLFYNNPDEWIKIQKNCIALNGSHFNTHRMLMEYLMKGYII